MSGHDVPVPVNRKFFTKGVFVLIVLILIGLFFAIRRFTSGLAAVTNLDQQYPWGLWIAFDVATGVALAAGGFTTAALAHIFHREHYHAITRPALLTAMLGYTFVALGLLVDLGRPYNIWHPVILPQGNSVLFEVGMCVMFYLTVLYLEFLPIVLERFQDDQRFPVLSRLASFLNHYLDKIMFLLIIAGVVLSCLHQSSLGNLMVISPTKTHPLWYTEILSLLFLLSAFMVGFPMVIFESMFASWSFNLKPEMEILAPLSKYSIFLCGTYLAVKLADLFIRGAHPYLLDGSPESFFWFAEMGLGVALPFFMLLSAKVRHSPKWLFTAALLIVLGVALNRLNVFIVAYHPPYADEKYFPSFGVFAVTVGLVSALILIYRTIVTFFPVITHPELAARKA